MPDEFKTTDKVMTMEDLKSTVATMIKEVGPEMAKAAIAELKTATAENDRKVLFPSGEAKFGYGDYQTLGGSVIDTTFLTRRFKSMAQRHLNAHAAGHALGMEFVNMGGPFKKLSPAMETFAKILINRGKMQGCIASGIDLGKYNAAQHEIQIAAGIRKAAGMSEGVLADGGATVPVEYASTVIEFAFTQSPILSRVWRWPMTSQTVAFPRLTQSAGSYFGGVQFFSPGEGELKEDTKPSFDRPTLTARKRCAIVYMTDELVQDSLINIVNYVTGLMTRAFMYDMENLVLTNTAAAQLAGTPCLGIIPDPLVVANGIARNTAGTINYADLCGLDGQLDEAFSDLCWMTRKKTLATLRNERDTQNRPIVQVDYDGLIGQHTVTPSIFGYPIYLTRNCPAMGTQGDIVLGDLSMYLLAIRQDLTIDMSQHVRFIYDEETLRFVARYDGMAVVPIAFTELVGAAS